MAETRRRFDPEFRAGAVRIVRETGKSIAQVARDLGINSGTLANWVQQDRAARVAHAVEDKEPAPQQRNLDEEEKARKEKAHKLLNKLRRQIDGSDSCAPASCAGCWVAESAR